MQPDASSGLVIDNAAVKQLGLTWTDNANNEQGYRAYSSINGVDYSLLTTLAADATSYISTGLAWNTTYYCKVLAYNEIESFPASGSATTAAGTLSGNYNIGSGEAYEHISDAITALAINGLSGNY